MSQILLLSQSSPFPILRDHLLRAPEYHREYGRRPQPQARTLDLRWVHLGSTQGPARAAPFLPSSRLSPNTSFRREWVAVDASHDAVAFLLGTLRVNGARHKSSAIRTPKPHCSQRRFTRSAVFRRVFCMLRDWGPYATNHVCWPSG